MKDLSSEALGGLQTRRQEGLAGGVAVRVGVAVKEYFQSLKNLEGELTGSSSQRPRPELARPRCRSSCNPTTPDPLDENQHRPQHLRSDVQLRRILLTPRGPDPS
jgi:hypothetical protein